MLSETPAAAAASATDIPTGVSLIFNACLLPSSPVRRVWFRLTGLILSTIIVCCYDYVYLSGTTLKDDRWLQETANEKLTKISSKPSLGYSKKGSGLPQ